jgi:hypothetical protein
MVVKCIAIVFNVSAKEFVLAQLPRNLRSVTNQAVKVIDIKTPYLSNHTRHKQFYKLLCRYHNWRAPKNQERIGQ